MDGKTFSLKPSPGKSSAGKSSPGKSSADRSSLAKSSFKPNPSSVKSGKKSSPKSKNGRGRGIEQKVINEDNGVVEASWQLESSNRNNRSVPYSTRTLDPIIATDFDKGTSKDDGTGGNGFCNTIKSHKKCLILGFVLFLIVDFVLLGVFLLPGRNKKNASSNSANAASGNDGYVVGTPEDPPNAAPSDNIGLDDPNGADTDPPTDSPTEDVYVWTNSGTVAPFDSSDEDYSKVGRYEVLETVPHDTSAFTQGLEILSQVKITILKDWKTPARRMLRSESERFLASTSSFVVESTGQYGSSDIRIVHLATGQVIQTLELEDEYFGEGCTYYYVPNTDANGNDVIRIVQLTWKELRGFVYELSVPPTITTETQLSLSRIGEFEISETDHTKAGRAWGIVFHPIRNQFIVTDGSRFLHIWELTETTTDSGIAFEFVKVDRMKISQNRDGSEWTSLAQVNELEWDPFSYGGNTILGNVWQTDEIVRIFVGVDSENKDPQEGKVTHIYDLSEVTAEAQPDKRGAVLNGIAFVYDSVDPNESPLAFANQFWITGKLWPSMYRIKLFDD